MSPLIPVGSPQPSLFRLGVVSDVQYADVEDGASFWGTPRFYRHSLQALKRAMMFWNQNNVHMGINLGDIIDGKSQGVCSETAMTNVLNSFNIFNGKTHHAIGNHCLYNFDRNALHKKLQINGETSEQSYYSVEITPDWKIIVVDSYDVATIGREQSHPHTKLAHEILEKNNPNECKYDNSNMAGPERRFVCFGGGIGFKQLQWLRNELQTAQKLSQKVLIFGHIPFFEDDQYPACLLWNYEEVLDVVHEFNVVVATFAGHAHTNSHQIDLFGVHHVALPSMLETLPGNDCFGWIDFYEEGVELVGYGEMDSVQIGGRTRRVQEQALV
eukprot:TRINITY_DN9727_c0_g1_i13.p2 TRINITY_DN9727_c0_g1~~TRINITY_DN9727_c0_g1_i13.p2  ORF type:complete len:366 (-),score=60.97 TRINITY_DN9727_c0_g1_i13:913-1896(-)